MFSRCVIYGFKATAMLLLMFTQVAGILMFCPKTTWGPPRLTNCSKSKHLVTETDTLSYSAIIFCSSDTVIAYIQLSDHNTLRFSWHIKTIGPGTIAVLSPGWENVTSLVLQSQRHLVYHNTSVTTTYWCEVLESTFPNTLFSFLLTHTLKYKD